MSPVNRETKADITILITKIFAPSQFQVRVAMYVYHEKCRIMTVIRTFWRLVYGCLKKVPKIMQNILVLCPSVSLVALQHIPKPGSFPTPSLSYNVEAATS